MRHRRVLFVLAIIAIVLLAGCYGWLQLKPRKVDAEAVQGGETIASTNAAQALMALTNVGSGDRNEPPGDSTPDIRDYIPPGSEPPVGDVIARLRAAGINTGIAAFNPPGTSPPLIGIAVPVDFPLPEGFVRHGQATDGGQPIEPILMFSPDYDFFDAQGRPIQVPENRVVPPQYAPPGLKIRMIRIPPPQ